MPGRPPAFQRKRRSGIGANGRRLHRPLENKGLHSIAESDRPQESAMTKPKASGRISVMPLSSENIRVRRAVHSDAHALTRLVFRAKAFWGYPKEWMEEWRQELTVTSDYVAKHRVVLAEADQRLVAFYGLELKTDIANLGHLWVEPARIGSGL